MPVRVAQVSSVLEEEAEIRVKHVRSAASKNKQAESEAPMHAWEEAAAVLEIVKAFDGVG